MSWLGEVVRIFGELFEAFLIDGSELKRIVLMTQQPIDHIHLIRIEGFELEPPI